MWHGSCKKRLDCVLPHGHRLRCKIVQTTQEEEYEVECVTGERSGLHGPEFFVKWRGWPEEDSTWENETALVDCPLIMATWRATHGIAKPTVRGGKPLPMNAQVMSAKASPEPDCDMRDVGAESGSVPVESRLDYGAAQVEAIVEALLTEKQAGCSPVMQPVLGAEVSWSCGLVLLSCFEPVPHGGRAGS